MSTKTVSLYCPSRNLTVPAFVISPFQKLDQVLQGVRLALDIPYAAIYTVDAKHVTDPQSLDDGQRVLVAVDEDEEMLPDAQERGCVVYLGEDEEMWEMLNDVDKTTHMIDLINNDPTTRNILRLTRTWEDVRSDVRDMFSDVVDSEPGMKPEASRRDSSSVMAKDTKTKKEKNIAASMQELKIKEQEEESDEDFHSLIETRWEMTVEAFLHPVTAHHKTAPKNKPAAHIPKVIVAALALMASATHGQPRLAREILEEAIRLRVDNTAQSSSPTGTNSSPSSSGGGTKAVQEKDIFALITKVDINNAIEIMYERARVLVTNWTKEKKQKGEKVKGESGRERRKRAKEARRSGGTGA